MDLHFEVTSCLGKHIGISNEEWNYLIHVKHPELAGREEEIKYTLAVADFVRLSQRDKDVYLYYKRIEKYYLCVVCRHLDGSGFIITSYFTSQLKRGKEQWPK